MANRDLELKIRALVEGAKDVDELKKGLKDLSGQRVGDNTRDMRRGFDKSQRSVDGLRNASRLATRALGALGLAFGAAQVAQFAQRTLEASENTVRLSDSLDAQVSTVEELTYTFQQFRLGQNDVADALATLSDRAEDAKSGTKSMIEDFGLLGISVEDLRNKDPGELFALFAEGVKNTEDPGKRLAGVVRTLGDDLGRKLLPLLLEGEDGLNQFADAGREAGAVMGDELRRQGAAANRELREIRTQISSEFARTVLENADAIEDLGGAVATLVGWLAKGAEHYVDFGKFIGEGIARLVVADTPLAKLDSAVDQIERIDGRLKAIRQQPGYENNQALTDLIDRLETRRAELQEVVESYEYLRDAGQGKSGATSPKPSRTSTDTGDAGDGTDDSDGEQKKIDAIIKKLQEQADTYGKTSEAVAIYRLEQMGATDAEIKQARAINEKIVTLNNAEEADKAAAKAAKERAEEVRKNAEADADLVAQMEEEIRLAGLSARARAEEIAVSQLSADATDKQREAVRRLAGELFTLKEKSEETTGEMSEFATQAARNMQTALADYLFDPFDEGLEGMARGFADTIRRMTAEAIAAQALQSFFSGIAGATTGGTSSFFATMAANVQHTGGMAGTGPTRQVSPFLFMGAPRYHKGGMAGLAPDEVPAILQRGEQVLSRSEVQQNRQQQQPAMSGGRLQVGLEDGLVARLIKSDEGQDALAEVVHRNPKRFGR
ncbi:hypothetical protein [Thiohalophilus sp.]|uniref:hypothetical protein n=1 Tax=Thiohalophilus sp. TaxID=3028392 RepID=UPI002ACD7037|nr:hypothetical protein [Thiohalophilus sp.]MDZ7803114.1 hypothetical protein [Thiohalophilus sp.]